MVLLHCRGVFATYCVVLVQGPPSKRSKRQKKAAMRLEEQDLYEVCLMVCVCVCVCVGGGGGGGRVGGWVGGWVGG